MANFPTKLLEIKIDNEQKSATRKHTMVLVGLYTLYIAVVWLSFYLSKNNKWIFGDQQTYNDQTRCERLFGGVLVFFASFQLVFALISTLLALHNTARNCLRLCTDFPCIGGMVERWNKSLGLKHRIVFQGRFSVTLAFLIFGITFIVASGSAYTALRYCFATDNDDWNFDEFCECPQNSSRRDAALVFATVMWLVCLARAVALNHYVKKQK